MGRLLSGDNLSVSLDNFAALQAGRANANTLAGTLNYGAHLAQIYVPAPLGDIVGVADVIPELRPFAAHFTYACHKTNSNSEGLEAASEKSKMPEVIVYLKSSG